MRAKFLLLCALALSACSQPGIVKVNGEDPLQEEMATHSSILAWKIPWAEEPGGL